MSHSSRLKTARSWPIERVGTGGLVDVIALVVKALGVVVDGGTKRWFWYCGFLTEECAKRDFSFLFGKSAVLVPRPHQKLAQST